MFKNEQNPSMNQQLSAEEAERVNKEKKALQELLDELDNKTRDLSSAEMAFLQRQSDRIENELARSNNEPGTEHDLAIIQSEKINNILKN